MDIKELRVGNWINVGYDRQWEPADYMAYWKGEGDNDAVEPIPLTPEILEKAGFSLQPQRQSIYLRGRVKLWMGHNGCIAYLKHEDRDESYYIPNPCQYVHQLQNLYFALMGEELMISL